MSTSPKKSLRLKRQVMDGAGMHAVLRRMAGELLERHGEIEQLLLVGIHTRGVQLAERLIAEIERMEGRRPRQGEIDITFYRDDLSLVDEQPVVGSSSLGFDVAERDVLLVDDVLYTGRTTRAALESILDYGRPRKVQLAALIDRGHRELPIQADYVGKYVETSADEVVEVQIPPFDERTTVFLTTKELLLKARKAAKAESGGA